MQQEELFTEVGSRDYEIDNTEISSILIYYSKEELIEFKKLCKIGMKIEFDDYIHKANISDFLLKVLKKHYANDKT